MSEELKLKQEFKEWWDETYSDAPVDTADFTFGEEVWIAARTKGME